MTGFAHFPPRRISAYALSCRSTTRLALLMGLLAAGLAADEAGDWNKAHTRNSTAAYSEYLKKHPAGVNAPDAKHRVNNLHYAFFVTCWQGTTRAADGFIESHPDSSLTPAMREFREYLAALVSIEKTRALLAAQPPNPFGPFARARIPALYLEAVKARVGIRVDVGDMVRGGAWSKDAAGIRSEEVQHIQKKLASFGIASVDAGAPGEGASGEPVSHLLSVRYDQEYRPLPKAPDSPLSTMPGEAPKGLGLLDKLTDAIVLRTTGENYAAMRKIGLSLSGSNAQVFSEIVDFGRPARLVDPAMALSSLGADASAMSSLLLMDQMRSFSQVFESLARYGREADITAATSGMAPPLWGKETAFAIGSAAIRNPEVGVLSAFLKSRLSADARGEGGTPLLMDAIRERRLAHAGVLLQAKAKPNGVDSKGQSALHAACEVRELEGVRLLLKAGADPNLLDGSGVSPLLMAAAQQDSRKLLEILLPAAGNLNAPAEDGTTPLIRVVKSGNVAGALSLIRLGADPNVTSSAGDPPLVLAAAAGRADMVGALREAGAATSGKNARGLTALDIAVDALLPDVVAVLADSPEMGREVRAWRLVKDSKDRQLLESFVQRYPSSVFRKSAEEKLSTMKQ